MVDTLAVFDFDGTITRGDTLVPLLARVSPTRTARHAPLAVAKAQRDRDRRDEAKEQLLAAVLADVDEDRVHDIGAAFVRSRLDRLTRSHVMGRLRRHQAAGHFLILASASPQFVVEPAARHLGFDRVLCTRVVRGERGWRLQGQNLRGEVKRRAVEHAAGELRPACTWAYGDSSDDLPLLRWAHHGFRVRRRALEPVASSSEATPERSVDATEQLTRWVP
jgi:HAD superfamily hydrolase (TIGR01490 family)